MSAFDNFNDKNTINSLIDVLGLKSGRMRSFGPCLSCNAEQRGSSDKRLPLGVTENLKGWHCHKCKISGNLVDLLCLKKTNSRYSDADENKQKKVLNWLIDNGYEDQKYSNKPISKKPKFKSTSDFIQKNEKAKVDTTSPFRWEVDLYEDYKQNLYSEKGKKALEYLTERRKLSSDVIDEADLGYMEFKGSKWIVIPLKDEDGDVVNMRFRSLPPQKKDWRLCAGRPMPLYGEDTITQDRSSFIIIVEGELDVLAMKTYGYERNVVSGTAGATCNWKEKWLNALEPYQGFYLWYDNDQAGDEGAEKLATKLGKYRSFRIKSDENDISDCLIDGQPLSYIQKILEDNIQPFLETSLKKCDEYSVEIEKLVLNPLSLKGLPTGSSKLDPLLGGIRPGLWVVSGDTGHGKTTFLTWLLWEQALRHVPVMVTSFEQRPIGTVQKLLRCQLGGDFTKVTEQERKQGLQQLGQLPIHILDHYGELEPDKVIESIRFATRRYDIKIALVDHLGFLVRANEQRDERQSIELIVRKLATIAVQDNITIMLVCHPNNVSVSQQRRVKITDLKGASAIRQDAHIGVIVERNEVTKDSLFPTTTVWLDKVRSEFGQAGSHCTLVFDPLSCVYADDWSSTPSGQAGKTVICHTPISSDNKKKRRTKK
jgi:5S rRNA maturation endonuclease (ribonuclease M5)